MGRTRLLVAGAGCLALVLLAPEVAGAQVELLKQWSGANGGFALPADIATDAAVNVYVADGPNRRVQKFTTEGQFLTQWGSFGSDNGEFEFPRGVVVGPQGFVYVVDTDLARVQLFTTNGRSSTCSARWEAAMGSSASRSASGRARSATST